MDYALNKLVYFNYSTTALDLRKKSIMKLYKLRRNAVLPISEGNMWGVAASALAGVRQLSAVFISYD